MSDAAPAATSDSMGKMLGKRLGPLPVAGWVAAILGGLGISWYLRSRGGAAPEEPPAAYTDPGALGTSTTYGTGGAAYSDPANPGNISDPIDPENAGPGTVSITTNGQWRTQAVKYLIGLGNTGTAAETAVGNYLAGRLLTVAQVAMVNAALAGVGPTPQAVPIIKTTTPTTTTPGTTTGETKPPPKTNAEWAPRAVYWLSRNGYTKDFAYRAVNLYVTGGALATQQAAAIKKVNAGWMPPPTPIKLRLTAAAIHALQTAPTDARRDVGTDTNPT